MFSIVCMLFDSGIKMFSSWFLPLKWLCLSLKAWELFAIFSYDEEDDDEEEELHRFF